ncbi:MAG: DEAD/DEAH box helicase family protein [Candidatus Altiarchaeota archaeon]|nr:DEAD/DEAH box helicase family protein [Candidatus Altiarchaeota archaeon]
MSGLSEHQTRKRYIDRDLGNGGWLKKYIKEEVNSVKSDFKQKDFVLFDGRVEKGVDRFVDYVLLGEDNSVLAVIEVKRFSLNEEKGRIQARTYAKDIEKQVSLRIPIFLTNGEVWRFIDEDGVERRVSGPFSQEDLRRRGDLFKNRRDPRDVRSDSRIVDRPRSLQVVRALSEHFSGGHRKALVHMATGTGKTRVAMALIKVLIDANMVRNVLFIADRVALVNQAKSSGFKQFFAEPVSDLRQGFTTTGRLYVSTVQTLMGGKPKRLFERFSPGFFDLIVFDEAHRSYYDKNDIVGKYFDAIHIGLTATPREHELESTYDLFECEQGKPTVEYSYDEAVLEDILVPYRGLTIDTAVLSGGIRGSELTKGLKDRLRRQEVDPEIVEFSGSQFDRVFMDDKTNEVIVSEFMNHSYKSDEGKPCKSIFFCASQRHARHMKKIFGRLFPKLSSDVQVITSMMDRAEDEVRRFQNESEPRIALSVGMLDTGVDVPEVCNLVFVKPVFSHIRFWQMIGRGTRNLEACKHPEWLQDRGKKDFLIFDFKVGGHSNIEYHNLGPLTERPPRKDVVTRIFENRVGLLEKPLDGHQKEIVSGKIMYDVDSLDTGSFIVREKSSVLYKVKENSFNLERYIRELREEISPLLVLKSGGNPNVSSFILNTEKLFGYILDRDLEKIENIRVYVLEMAGNILQRDSLSDIRENKHKITRVFQEDFWGDLSFDDVEFLIKELAPLMRYFEPSPRRVVQVDAPDLVLSREEFEREIKEDTGFMEFLEGNPLVRKIRDGVGVTSRELLMLEAQLSELRPGFTIENVQRHQNKDFLVFLREIIGLSQEYDPRVLIERRFDEFIIENNVYGSRQLEFLRLLKKVFAERKYIEVRDLGKPPLAEEHPLDYFRIDELKEIVGKCNQIKMY